MTNSNSNSTTEYQEPFFQDFRWHRDCIEQADIKGITYANLAGLAKDVAMGCNTILEIIEFNSLQKGDGEKPILHASQIGNLLRLASQSLKFLDRQAEDGMEWIYEYRTKEGKAAKSGGNS